MDLILAIKNEAQMSTRDGERISFTITDDVIAAQVFVFFASGYETTAMTITFLLYELAANPDVQDKLVAEIDKKLLVRYIPMGM